MVNEDVLRDATGRVAFAPGEHKVQELREWWMGQAEREVEAVVPKAVEYGSADLEVMGRAMEMLLPGEPQSEQDVEDRRVLGVEMAIAFYALGKVSRLFGSYERGKAASDDTWHDLGVYCRMAQRVRETGRWT